jgi:hypothetical protein
MIDTRRSLRVLFTVQTLEGRAGGSLYVRDFMLELLRRGHRPVVFSTRLGALAAEIRGLTIPVIDRLDKLTAIPDIIHGNSPIETMAALLHFPDSPAIFTCHGWDSPDAIPPKMPRLVRYIAVDETCRDRLVCHEGIPEDRVLVHYNPVDLTRFLPRGPLPERPQRALVFSNNARETNYLPSVRQACERAGVPLDVAGEGSHRLSVQPELILGGYDIVFAKARCALEALAVGTSVILCDETGMGPMVTLDDFRALRRMNFGRRALRNPVEPDRITAEIQKYNAGDATRVSQFIRESEGLQSSAESLENIYIEAIEDFRNTSRGRECDLEQQCAAAFLQDIAPFSNTFYFAEQVRSAERHSRETTIRELAEVMAMHPLPLEDRRQIQILNTICPNSVRNGESFPVVLDLENGSRCFLASYAPNPVHIAFHWIKAETLETAVFEGARSRIYPPLPPGRTFRYTAKIQAPDEPGTYLLRLTLVQESITWFDTDELQCFVDVPVLVS